MARASLLVAVSLFFVGCRGERPPFSVEIVTAEGHSPVAGADQGSLRILVAQDGQPTREQSIAFANGTFELDVTIASHAAPTRLGVELVRDGATLLGAVPSFAPIGYGFVRVPVVPAGGCAMLATQRLTTPRVGAALVSIRALVALVGGTTMEGLAAEGIERFWAPLLTASEGSGPILRTDRAFGVARALRLAEQERIVVLGAHGGAVLDFSAGADGRVMELTGLHPGAGEHATLVDLGGAGIAIVGGLVGDVGSDRVSWIGPDRRVSTSRLPTGRRDTAAVAWDSGRGILVAGGNAPGEPTFLFVPTTPAMREAVVAFDPPDPLEASMGGWLVRAPDGSAALYIGALEPSGQVTRRTWLVTGCPADCTAVEGPSWDHPRDRAGFVQTSSEGWILGGREADGVSARVDRVAWTESVPTLVSTHLATPREEPAAVTLAAGMILVAGGRGSSRVLDDFELCAPDRLGPL